MYYEEDVINDLLAHADIVDVVQKYVSLKPQGSDYKGICPFHSDKNPSMSVSRRLQIFNCFACQTGGNAITFIKNYENIKYPEAIERLADMVGYKLPKPQYSAEEKEKIDSGKKLKAVNTDAATFYFKLLHSDAGKPGLDYFTSRGLSMQTIKDFGLGFAPDSYDALYKWLKNKGYGDDILSKSGLFIYNERGVIDKFRNRVMFPIIDNEKKVIAFGGRIMGKGEPKYLNSPETDIFHKSNVLYGMNIARRTRAKYMIICEGYMDVIALHQAGFDMAVAALGTAFTTSHAKMLKSKCDTVYMTFDSDGAGVKAALRAIPILKAQNLNVQSIDLRPYKDPDEFIKALGNEKFKERIEGATNSIMYRAERLSENCNMNDPDGKIAFLEGVARILSEIENELQRVTYTDSICKRWMITGEQREALVKLIERYGNEAYYAKENTVVEYKPDKAEKNPYIKNEKLLLAIICREPEVYNKIKSWVTYNDFSDDIYKEVAEYVFGVLESGQELMPAIISNRYTREEDIDKVNAILSTDVNIGETKDMRSRGITEIIKKLIENSMSKNLNPQLPMDEFIKRKKQLERLRIDL
ncbi:MAG TPA: DNA primase [Eubacterium sp.]|nr:DNA primase [Eubacterium sp.]